MIVTVTPNPALDHTWEMSELILGESHRVASGAVRAGGKGINVSRILHAVGYPTRAVTTAGGATGALLRAELDASGIPHDIVEVSAPTRRSVAAVVPGRCQATVLNESGSELAPYEIDALDAAWRRAPRAAVVAICGSLPPGFPPARLAGMVRDAQAGGCRVVVDTSGPALMAAAAAGADILKPNRAELAAATGERGLGDGIRSLLTAGASLVAVSLAERGLVLATARAVVLAQGTQPIERGNPTGAGDAVVASLAAHLAEPARPLHSESALQPETALDPLARRAVQWSASAVRMPLAGDLAPDRGCHDDIVVEHHLPEDR